MALYRVTGGAEFIGSVLVRDCCGAVTSRWLQSKNLRLRIYPRFLSGSRRGALRQASAAEPDGVEWIRMSIVFRILRLIETTDHALGPLVQTSGDTLGANSSKFFSNRLAKSFALES